MEFSKETGRAVNCLILISVIGVVLLVIGVGRIRKGEAIPIYTDPGDPARLSEKLADLPREERFREWYRQLPAFETSHRHLVDTGHGLSGAGKGLLLAAAAAFSCLIARPRFRKRVLFVSWVTLWVITYPYIFEYYERHRTRFDYPTWGDTIAIGVMEDVLANALGLILSTVALVLLLRKREIESFRWPGIPHSAREWTRQIFMLLWMLITIDSAWRGLRLGDEATALSSIGAVLLLGLVFLAGKRPIEPVEEMPSPANDEPLPAVAEAS